jgi:F-type H+-transporting ATPase subunit a
MASLAGETLFHLFGQRVTNSLVTTLLVDGLIIALVVAVRRRLALVPGRLQGVVEGFVEYLYGIVEGVAGDRARKIFPTVAVFFIFIVVSNLLGLIPGFGSLGFWRESTEEGKRLVPLLHATTSDLNTTLALAIVSVLATHVLAIRSTGIKSYLKRFFALNPLLLFVGLLEIVQELTKFLSFSFRLFGNISGGHAVIGAMSSLFAFIVPIPFMALEILVGVVQAAVFAMLTMAFMSILTESHKQEESHQ